MEKSKAAPVTGIILTALAALLIAGLLTFAGPCATEAGSEPMSCFWAYRALLGAGGVLVIISIVRIFELDEGERRGLSLSAALLGILIAALPGGLISMCGDAAMHCNAVMSPFALVVGIAVGLVGGIDLIRRLLALRHR